MRALGLVVVLFLVSGCDALGDGPRSLPAVESSAALEVTSVEQLRDAYAAWQDAGVDAYEIRYRQSCFCAWGEVQARVEDGAVVEVWIDGELRSGEVTREVATMDQIFETAIEGFGDAERASARVLSDASPFLVDIDIDYVLLMADEEIGYEILGFERAD